MDTKNLTEVKNFDDLQIGEYYLAINSEFKCITECTNKDNFRYIFVDIYVLKEEFEMVNQWTVNKDYFGKETKFYLIDPNEYPEYFIWL